MPVRFVIGRAGSGKTYHCVESVRRRLRENQIEGPRLILLVPEQATLQTERAILEPLGVEKYASAADETVTHHHDYTAHLSTAHRVEVLSFERLASRVLESVGSAPRPALTESARAMVLRHLVTRHARDLRYYSRLAHPGRTGGRLSGFVNNLGRTISELLEETVAPSALSDLVAELESGSRANVASDPAQAAKLHDVAFIYQAYIGFLGDRLLDPSQYQQAARNHMGHCVWLHGAEVWIDGFASFSGQERLTLLELLRLCSHADIALLLDPKLLNPVGRDPADVRGTRIFSKMRQTYSDLQNRIREAGIAIDIPLVLDGPSMPRFRHSPELGTLEAALFNGPQPDLSIGGDRTANSEHSACVAENPHKNPTSSGGTRAVAIVQLPTRRLEVDYAVGQVIRWVQDRRLGYRFRDIAIIVRNMELYHDLLSEALISRTVPCFIDRRRPVIHHPLVELFRAVFAMASESLSMESVCAALKTGLLPISEDDADLLENYLIAHGIEGLQAWRAAWTYRSAGDFLEDDEKLAKSEAFALEKINRIRTSLVELLDPWLRFAETEAPNGAAWADALHSLLQRLRVSATLSRWAVDAEQDGDREHAEEHRQVWSDVMSLVDDLRFALADLPMGVLEAGEVMDAGLSDLTLAFIPPTIDQVLVGSIERSRHPNIKAAVIVGLNDGVFPERPAEDAVLNDDDRSLLLDAGLQIGPPAARRFVDESSLFYVALTRASERFLLTYSAADEAGRALRPSSYLLAVSDACPAVEPVILSHPTRVRDPWDIMTSGDLVNRLTTEFRHRPAAREDNVAIRAQWNALYDLRRLTLSTESNAIRAMSALNVRTDARLSPAIVKRLFSSPLRTSVSQLESYAACPFQFFSRHGLGIRQREHAKLEPIDVGLVHHAVLEDFVRRLAAIPHGWDALSEEDLIRELQESCRRVEQRLPEDATTSHVRNAYLLRRSAAQLARVIRAQQHVGKNGRSRPRSAELPFGFDTEGSLPALQLQTPSGRPVLIRGYIDRVDVAELSDEALGVVIDYKRTRDKRLDLSRVYHGLSLQLIAYLLVLAEHGRSLTGRPIRPIGAMFVGLMSQYESVIHPKQGDSRSTSPRRHHPPRGLISIDDIGVLDSSGKLGPSDSYAVHRKKDGSLGLMDKTDAADGAGFDATLGHVRRKLGELADGILEGDVTPRPYRLGTFSPCSWCEMATVCRFDISFGVTRFLDPMKRTQVFARLTVSHSNS